MRMQEYFPDGTPISDWFYDTALPTLAELGTPYLLTEHGVADDGKVYTAEIQALINADGVNGFVMCGEGTVNSFLLIHPWTQFFDLKGREDIPLSYADHITLKNCRCDCRTYFAAEAAPEQYKLSDFVPENLDVRAENIAFDETVIEKLTLKNVNVTAL